MIRLFACLGFICLASAGSATNDGSLQRLLTADEAREWQAVGRINMQGAGFCTGTLIAPDLVLTAAHCMYSARTKTEIAAHRIHFVAGWRKGWAAAHRKARRVIIHPEFDYAATGSASRVTVDLALVELESPIRSPSIRPFERQGPPSPGDPVTVVSYAQDRSEVPSMQAPCHMISRQSDMLLLSCDIGKGSSGAPIFVETDGIRRVASIVSAMINWDGRKVAIGAALGRELDVLMALRDKNGSLLERLRPSGLTIGTGANRPDTTGRKRVTPPS